MNETMYDNLRMYFPFVISESEQIVENGNRELIAYLKDGSVLSYNDYSKTLRKLPSDSKNMTETECRHEFGIRLRHFMELKGVSQLELSNMTGISTHMICKYITGKSSPSFYNADKIAKALNCSIEEFRYK